MFFHNSLEAEVYLYKLVNISEVPVSD